jgi:hypothetical protein
VERLILFDGRALEKGRTYSSTQHATVIPMGDKSPKAKEKSKKQGTTEKNQKKAAAVAKAASQSASTPKQK